jgi:hypothetical protein
MTSKYSKYEKVNNWLHAGYRPSKAPANTVYVGHNGNYHVAVTAFNGRAYIVAGCRMFTFEEALQHWGERYHAYRAFKDHPNFEDRIGDAYNRALAMMKGDSMESFNRYSRLNRGGLLGKARRIATARGWKIWED